ncbi:redoxin domain-containing protein [bacterium]|nr:redoxin domain-containing protein [bacterium]
MKSVLLLAFAFLLTPLAEDQKPKPPFAVGDVLPAMEWVDAAGSHHSFESLSGGKTLVLVFYRGEWCPYCSRYLSAWIDLATLIDEKDAVLVAISPEFPEKQKALIDKTEWPFMLVSDPNSVLARAWGISRPVSGKLREQLATDQETDDPELPVPMTVVVGPDRVVRYLHFDPDYKNRPDPLEVVKWL